MHFTHLGRIADAVDEDSIIRSVPSIPVLQQVRLQGIVPQDAKRQVEQLQLPSIPDLVPGEVVKEAGEATGVCPGPCGSCKGSLLVHQTYMPAQPAGTSAKP